MKKFLKSLILFLVVVSFSAQAQIFGQTAPILIPDGTVGSPSYSFSNNPTAGLYRIGANSIGMSVNGVLNQTWNATGTTVAGKITSSLTGVGATFLEGANTTNETRLVHLSQTGTDAYVGVLSSAGGGLVTGGAAYALAFRNDTGFVWGVGATKVATLDGTALSANALIINGGSTLSAYSIGTFTVTLTGCTTGTTGTAYYSQIGNMVIVEYPILSCTSNSVSKTLTGQIGALGPGTGKDLMAMVSDNGGAYAVGLARVAAGTGVVTLSKDVNGAVFTAAGTYAQRALSLSYTTQ